MKITVDPQGNVDPPGALGRPTGSSDLSITSPTTASDPSILMRPCPNCGKVFSVKVGVENVFNHDCPKP